MLIESMRLDKWLWAARFFKTRGLAQKQIELGRIKVNGEKVKNSKTIQAGDLIDMRLNSLPFRFTVLKLNLQRRPAPEAQLLYQEDEETMQRRQVLKSQLSLNPAEFVQHGRPTKRDRRTLDKFKQNN